MAWPLWKGIGAYAPSGWRQWRSLTNLRAKLSARRHSKPITPKTPFFVNSLPRVSSQLDDLGLCDAVHLVQLKNYVKNRQAWFDRLIDCHKIPDPYDANTAAKDVAKALPIRLLHGGSYLAWVRDFGLEPRGVESGTGGYWRVWQLARELKAARADTVASVAVAQPEWVRQALGQAEAKKAKALRDAQKVAGVILPMRENGASLRTICGVLNASGARTSRGGEFHSSLVSRMLKTLTEAA